MTDDRNIRQLPQQTEKPKRDRIGLVLYIFYTLLLVISALVLVKLVYYQLIWKPEPKIATALTPGIVKRTVEPVRGNIIDCDGRLLAMSYPVYDIHMDCTVMKADFAKMKNRNKAKMKEDEWLGKARELAEGLARLVPGTSADKMYGQIKEGRANGRKYLAIAKGVDRSTMLKIKGLPLFKEGANKGGMIVETRNIRKYPYGKLARRTIGFVRDNKGLPEEEIKGNPGLEGRYDAILHGKDGREYLRLSDRGRVRNYDSSYVRAIDGQDLRTTLNIDYQDVADRALHEQIDSMTTLNGACLVLMEVKTGAIRAMVNLSRDPHRAGNFEEITNFAIGRRFEPGSVFKTVTLLSVLSDGYVKSLDETLPTNHGWVKDTKMKQDIHIADWEREHKTREISVRDGFKISSNYVFGTLAVQNYAKNPRQYVEKVYSYGLGDSFDFDLEGLLTPNIPDPKNKNVWSNTTLGNMGFGYVTELTPLHILTFYNAIANKGRMVKPYLVEDIEKAGSVTDRRGPSVLNASICSKAIADTMTRALLSVTEEGTAKVLKKAKCTVAGKTGTSFGTFPGSGYTDASGRRKYQGTFVGYFPAEDPQYSVVCSVFSDPTYTNYRYQGGGIPAATVKTLVDYVYTNDPRFRTKLPRK